MGNETKRILIIGGGVAGLSAAVELAALDYAVTLIEKSDALGGHAARFACKATSQCVKCGACLLEQLLGRISHHPDIDILLQSGIAEISRNGRFAVGIQSLETSNSDGNRFRISLKADAVIVATGFEPFNPVHKPYGYNRFKDVITNLELDHMLRKEGRVKRPSNGAAPRNIAFIQCVGSRDAAINHPWCSRICCGSALRMADRIRWQYPGTEITMFYIDIQTFGKDFQTFFNRIREDIRLIRTMPGDIFPTEDSRLQVGYFDDELRAEAFDLVVLSVGMTPRKDNVDLFKQLRQPATETPGLLPYEKAAFDFQGGIFSAGAVLGPMSIADSITSAQKAAQEVVEYLLSGGSSIDRSDDGIGK